MFNKIAVKKCILATLLMLLGGGSAAADDTLIAKGKALFVVCKSCHATNVTPTIKIGPSLKGILNRDVASITTFSYSTAMNEVAVFKWDETKLDAWLQNPQKVVPGNMMSFAGLKKPSQREAIIAYLKTL